MQYKTRLKTTIRAGIRCFLIFPIVLLLVSCDETKWHKTQNGSLIYGVFDDNSTLVWEGNVWSGLVEGDGVLTEYDKSGKKIKSNKIKVSKGLMSDYLQISTACTEEGMYIGEIDDDLPDGFGVLYSNDGVSIGTFEDGKMQGNVQVYNNGQLVYEGGMKKGERNGAGKEYSKGVLVYEGYYKKGLKSGVGKLYKNGVLVYDGEWKKDKRDGYGKSYNDKSLIVYEGEWDDDKYDGEGKLYEKGKCIEGKWDEGQLTKSISTSVFNEIGRSINAFWGADSLNMDVFNDKEIDEHVAKSKIEFVNQLTVEVNDYLKEKLKERVEDRFGFLHLLRMIFQPWFSSDVSRARYAEEYFCENLQAKDLQQLINSKIDYFNSQNSTSPLNYVSLKKIPQNEIVDTNVAIRVFDREAMELTDVIGGVVVDLIICWVVGFIIGFIIGCIPPLWFLLPYVGVIDTILGIVAFVVAIYFSIFHTTVACIEMENQIVQMLIENYNSYLNSQNIVEQMLGVL